MLIYNSIGNKSCIQHQYRRPFQHEQYAASVATSAFLLVELRHSKKILTKALEESRHQNSIAQKH